jgi:hypothetical protein
LTTGVLLAVALIAPTPPATPRSAPTSTTTVARTLVIGDDNEDVGSADDAGAVNVLYGGADGLKTGGDQLFRQRMNGVRGVSETAEEFGIALVG